MSCVWKILLLVLVQPKMSRKGLHGKLTEHVPGAVPACGMTGEGGLWWGTAGSTFIITSSYRLCNQEENTGAPELCPVLLHPADAGRVGRCFASYTGLQIFSFFI